MNAIEQRLAQVRQNIARAARDSGRSPEEVTLVAATKTQSDDTIRQAIAAGVATREIDREVHKFILRSGATPSFLNYGGFPASTCISVNEEVVHGFPGARKVREGDIVSIDVGAYYKGYHGDNAFTFTVGSIAPDVQQLLDATQEMSGKYADRPIITMSMGAGVVSRLCGEYFGSAMTFGAVGQVSAPGQIPVEELNAAMDILHRALAPRS